MAAPADDGRESSTDLYARLQVSKEVNLLKIPIYSYIFSQGRYFQNSVENACFFKKL
jgi:hypothetical protein